MRELPPLCRLFLFRQKVELFPLLKEKGGHNMETANCEPIPAAAQQDLTGSKTADLSVIYDSEDAISPFGVAGLDAAKGTVMGGQQVCNQTFRPDDDGK